MRCPDCNKFVGLEMQDPEGDVEVDADGRVTGNVRIVRNCSECNQELKEANLEINNEDRVDDIAEHRKTCKETELEVEATFDSIEEVVNKSKTGRPITNPRYMKTLFGASADITITCKCGETFLSSWDDKIQASAMEELG